MYQNENNHINGHFWKIVANILNYRIIMFNCENLIWCYVIVKYINHIIDNCKLYMQYECNIINY